MQLQVFFSPTMVRCVAVKPKRQSPIQTIFEITERILLTSLLKDKAKYNKSDRSLKLSTLYPLEVASHVHPTFHYFSFYHATGQSCNVVIHSLCWGSVLVGIR